MASANIYLNFDGTCQQALDYYKSVFGTEYTSISRYGDMPPAEGMEFPDDQKNLIMNAQLPMIGDAQIYASDILPQYGETFVMGNNFYICLVPDTREEADRIFAALSDGGKVEMPIEVMFWGDYFGSWTDKFGIQWMINMPAQG